jgi:sialic acid synthase SpsE/D-lyxose ketol-isomerase
MIKPLIIFEMANNHMGDLVHAKRIIDIFSRLSKNFKESLDFAMKFQFRDLDSYIHKSFKFSDHPQVKRFLDTKLTNDQWKYLIKYTKKKGFITICTAFDENSVNKVIKNKFDFLKIASCSMDEWPLLEYISKKCKKIKIICSLGGANRSSIRNNISFFTNKNLDVKYLYCVAKYPTKSENLNLEYFKYLKSIYPEKIYGYSTHENPEEKLAAGLVYAMGGKIFEKHIGLSTKKYSLNKYSSDPQQTKAWLECLVDSIDRCGSIQNRDKYLGIEQKNLNIFKRGVFLKESILEKNKKEVLELKDVDFAFPSIPGQLTANDFSKFNTIKLKTKILPGKKILKKNVNIIDNRRFVELVRDKILNLIYTNSIIVNKFSKLEISHHYGIQNFYKFGLSMITIHNSEYCKKILFLFYKQKHPDQFHKKKKETFFIVFGKIKLSIKKNSKTKNLLLNTGDIYTINPNDIHSFEAVSKDGAIIEELSTKSMGEDSFYLDKKITNNKNRKSFISI